MGCSDAVAEPLEPEVPACWTGTATDPSFGTRDAGVFDELERAAGTAEDGAFYMLNLIQFRERACYEDGRASELTGKEANDLYEPLDHLLGIGAQPVFVADAEATLLGDGVVWDQIAIVLYPSRELFLSMVNDEGFQAKLVHKQAGLEKSIVMVSDLRASQLPDDFVPVDSPYPTTADDPSVEIVHVLKFREEAEYAPGSGEEPRTGEEAVKLYEDSAAEVALEIGVYPTAWFDVRGVLVGDKRTWDQFRINHMPSHAAFNALVADPRRQDGAHHREAGIEDTYTMIAAPLLNTLDPIGK
jgi:hypothetical protein